MSVSSVVQDFLNKGMECSIVNSLEVKDSRQSETLAFKLKKENILIVTEKEKEISFGKFMGYFKACPYMLGTKETRDITGHPSGCLSPFGLKRPLKVYMDVSLKQSNCISVSAGMKNFVVEITPGEMLRLTGGKWIDICSN